MSRIVRQSRGAADIAFDGFASGCIGVDVIALIEMIGLQVLNRRLTVAIVCLSASLPLLVLYILNRRFEATREGRWAEVWYHDVAFAVGALLTIAGMGAMTFHVSILAGIIFSILFFVGVIVHFHYMSIIDREE